MKRIGNYIVEETPLGRGGMGQVLKGVAADGNRPVAIKEILPQFVADIEFRSRIEREINFLKKLDNDNVVSVYDYFQLGANLYIVMELIEGMNIEEYVTINGPIPWEEAAKYMITLLNTLQDVHRHGIIHRDIKPGNIMIRNNGGICLLDFGVAKELTPAGNGGTEYGTVIGTNGYMSPEQAEGMSIDQRSDIYALGCVLFYMITGRHAFNTMKSVQETHHEILYKPFPRISDFVKGVPKAVQEVLDSATDKNMLMRFQSCGEFAVRLAQTLPGGTLINTAVNAGRVSVSIGRENCDFIVGASNFKVSRHHADVRLKQFTGGRYFVYTDCSSNGTVINGQTLTKGMSYNIPEDECPTVFLAGDPTCEVNIQDVKLSLCQIAEQRQRLVANSTIEEKEIGKNRNSEVHSSSSQNHQNNKSYQSADLASLSFLQAVKTCFSKYVSFSGRASKSEYWWFYLFNFMASTIMALIFFASNMNPIPLFCLGLYIIASFLPSISVLIRRLHDTDTSGAFLFFQLIPIAGFVFSIILLYKLCQTGQHTENRYGLPPGHEVTFISTPS